MTTQNGSHFADNSFLMENVSILIEISLQFFPKCSDDKKLSLVQVMAWYGVVDKLLLEPMMAIFTITFH